MPTNTMKGYIYLYGNNSIRNERFLIGRTENENASPLEVQTQILARNNGSRPTDSRLRPKQIKVKGEIAIQDLTLFDIEKSIRKLNQIYSQQYRTLRVIPRYITIADSNMSTQWAGSDDAGAITQDTSEFEFENKSCKFNIVVANSVNNHATLTGNLTNTVNISALVDKGSLDFWLDIPDVHFITSIEVRVGSSSSNYWSYNFTQNYEGRSLENGVNHFSCPLTKSSTPPCFLNKMTEVGGVLDLTIIDYLFVRINYSSAAINIPNCRFGEFFAVDETRVTNYLCYREGEIAFDRNFDYSSRVRKYEANLNNYTGFGKATHPKLVALQSGITALSNTQLVDFEGTFDPAPIITILLNAVTNLSNLTITNLNNGGIIQFTNTWAISDKIDLDKLAEIDAEGRQPVRRNGQAQVFDGRIPSFSPGKNRLRLAIAQANSTLVSQSVFNTSNQSAGYVLSGQSFIAPVSGTLTNLEIFCRNEGLNFPDIQIWSNNAGLPSALLATFACSADTSNNILRWLVGTGSLVVTSGTTYWIVANHVVDANSPSFMSAAWAYNTTSVVTGNRARASANGFVWDTTGTTTQDHAYKFTIEPTPSTNLDLSIQYTPLYA